jgi:hypothetical protein
MICPGAPSPQEKRAQKQGTRRTHDAMGQSPRLKKRSPPRTTLSALTPAESTTAQTGSRTEL